MAFFPGADRLIIDRYAVGGANHEVMTAQRLIYHTCFVNVASLFPSMNIPGTPVSHFFVRENGKVEQYVDTAFRSSACLDGNHDCIAIETWDGKQIIAWSPEQVEACAELAAWVNKEHGIPLEQLPNSVSGHTGVGWHRMGIPGNFAGTPGSLLGGKVDAGEFWTDPVQGFGKECPGDPRIKQVVELVLPRAIEIVNGDDMSDADVQAINDHTDAAIKHVIDVINARAAGQRALIQQRMKGLREAVDRNASPAEVKDLLQQLEASIKADLEDRDGRDGRGDLRGAPLVDIPAQPATDNDAAAAVAAGDPAT